MKGISKEIVNSPSLTVFNPDSVFLEDVMVSNGNNRIRY